MWLKLFYTHPTASLVEDWPSLFGVGTLHEGCMSTGLGMMGGGGVASNNVGYDRKLKSRSCIALSG